MRKLFALIILLAVAAGGAYVTKPGPAEFDTTLRKVLAERVASADLAESDSDLEALAMVGCKFSMSECFRAVRALMDVTFIDKGLYIRAEVHGPSESTCIGVFRQFWCGDAVF
jgi:hypothetical protein